MAERPTERARASDSPERRRDPHGEACDHRGFGFRMLYIPESTFREVASGWPPAGPNLHFDRAVVRGSLLESSLYAAPEV